MTSPGRRPSTTLLLVVLVLVLFTAAVLAIDHDVPVRWFELPD